MAHDEMDNGSEMDRELMEELQREMEAHEIMAQAVSPLDPNFVSEEPPELFTDVEADAMALASCGWGVDEESWSLDYTVFPGDPSDPNLWRLLDAYLVQPTLREDSKHLAVRTTCVDSGGHHTQTVYRWCKPRRLRRVFAIKGRADPATVWPPAYKAKKKQSPVTIVGTNAAKDAVYSRLKVALPGPGYCHFPRGRSPVWFEQLTSEVVQTKHVKGFPQRFYVLPDGRRNEALDCRVYAYAALQSLGVRWSTETLAARPAAPQHLQPVIAQAAAAAQALTGGRPAPAPAQGRTRTSGFLGPRRGSGWLNRR